MLSTSVSYNLAVRDLPRSLDIVQSDQRVKRDTEYYLENIQNVKSVDDLVKDDRLFAYAMKAHGLEDMTYAKALIVKALEGGHEERDAFVNRMADARYLELVKTFDFKSYDTATTSFSSAQVGVVNKYIRQQLEENAGSTNEGVRLALYFKRKAPQLTTTEGVLADRALSTVVRQALQIPEATAFLDIDKQVKMLEEVLDVKDFSDPEKLGKFIERFVHIWDATHSPPSPSLNLFTTGPSYGISTDMLLTIQSMK